MVMPTQLPKRCRICGVVRDQGVDISRNGYCPMHGAAVLSVSVELPTALVSGDLPTIQRILAPFGVKVSRGGGVGGKRNNRAPRTPKALVT